MKFGKEFQKSQTNKALGENWEIFYQSACIQKE